MNMFDGVEMKLSTTPPKGGWAAGWYINICIDCNNRYMGAKRSVECEKCAYKEKEDEK